MPQLSKSVPINIAGAATTHLVAAKTGFAIGVVGYVMMSGGTVNVTFQDTASSPVALTGPFPLTAQAGVSCPQAPVNEGGGGQQVWFQTTADKGLDIVTDSSAQLSGHLSYIFIPVAS